ncbi:hypothetical protein SAMN05216391_11953 [Lachnospiraceae bacterium KHCPX20]|nr:hypothetical protein SAMN05216391_11953 [Lachnospiraceae bacterium KHCPX20]
MLELITKATEEIANSYQTITGTRITSVSDYLAIRAAARTELQELHSFPKIQEGNNTIIKTGVQLQQTTKQEATKDNQSFMPELQEEHHVKKEAAVLKTQETPGADPFFAAISKIAD